MEKYSYSWFKMEYPSLYENVECGFSLPKGWGPLLVALSGVLEWYLSGGMISNLKMLQVKEKFGELRVYLKFDHAREDSWAEEVYGVVNGIRIASATTCQECGATHNVQRRQIGFLLATLCTEHYEESLAKQKSD